MGTPFAEHAAPVSKRRVSVAAIVFLLATWTAFYALLADDIDVPHSAIPVPHNARAILSQCATIHASVEHPADFALLREESDRYDAADAKPSLVRNATLWVGDGRVVHDADVLIAGGIIKFIGRGLGRREIEESGVQEHLVQTYNAEGAWVTPALIDLHSHAGVVAIPNLDGSSDGNSLLGPVQPWLRAIDGLNTHDDAYELAIAGGVATALVIPGSANAIGGQGFVVKLRPTKERSPFSKVVEPPFTYNGTGIKPAHPPKWRYLKQACGENPSRVYGQTRMDSIYQMRSLYAEAAKLREAQDVYCDRAVNHDWKGLGDFPEDLRLEALVDVLRGRVKVNTHCYEAVDLDNLVRLSNEFRFKIAAFHHAHETYLVPDVLKKAYGGAPASAIFSTFARYKREAYRGSEFAARILHDAGLEVIMKSDAPNPINMRDLLYEAQQAHYFGLPADIALASVISTPAKVLGLDHRLGFLRRGYDADLVIWDAHPLQIGATPTQVLVDGIPQLGDKPVIAPKTSAQQAAPKTPDFSNEAAAAVKYEGLPPLEPTSSTSVRFVNVKYVWGSGKRYQDKDGKMGEVVVRAGKIVCAGNCTETAADSEETLVDLKGGEIAPGLVAYGGSYALAHIAFETSTGDGTVTDSLPALTGKGALVKASDGLVFGTRDSLLAYRSGVTRAITAPESQSVISGLSAAVSLGAAHRLESGAIPQRVVSLNVKLGRGGGASVSTQIGILRNLLHGGGEGETGEYFKKAVAGELPLVVYAEGADIISSLLELKNDLGVDSKLRLVISGATEAHLLAEEIAKANVGVIVHARAYPDSWDQRRIAKRPPLESGNNLSILKAHNVSVAFGHSEMWGWRARLLRFDLSWAEAETDGALSRADFLALATTKLEALLGLEVNEADREMVAYSGGDVFSLESKVTAVIAPLQGRVDLF
ncbi:hypothetical protein EXIGLDRAFT_728044 [Exidia glandulosa HHB12029]|uniref:Amidohydrolase-related domain-containing protein n=1 Tax=Exidia glandulosa HHB12029 TaxID=1314781 RepID=A0A165D3G0_EXIGL|nr:hypothetical protein EXIGLDRAFT_728044 [Exidia glandulosa HHB12029]